MKIESTPIGGDDLQRVWSYHQRSKHAFGQYAAGPGYLDWNSQPNPFRRFADARLFHLPLTAESIAAPYARLFEPEPIEPAPLNLENLSALLELSFGLAAWKQHGDERWALRCNPSSGNLHPTEAYVIASDVAELPDGLYHYVSFEHGLEQRCRFDPPFRGIAVGLSSIHWREAWKYGERAFRYCQHDVGHALGALRYAAAALGWRVRWLDAWSDEDIAALLGIDRPEDFAEAESEAPDLLCLIETGLNRSQEPVIDELLQAARGGQWSGRANRLSVRHEHQWPVIEEVCRAARKPRTPQGAFRPSPGQPIPPLISTDCELSAVEIIKQRRSAQVFDGVTGIPANALFRLLDATLPRPDMPPFDLWMWPARVHLVLFVHRVQGLPPGVYVFCRRPEAGQTLKSAMKPDFAWEKADNCPAHFGFFRLLRGDARPAAKALSCHQDIAGDSAFSLGMLAEFDAGLREGPWAYRRLFWECGLIGQALYLEAEAAGVRGTGIGCFFDDPVHELLGVQDFTLQSLYHFTIGGARMDLRLQSLPGYWHLKEAL